ncbi:MAG: flagellar hook-length control protein FliK [Spirochaetota bacterium]
MRGKPSEGSFAAFFGKALAAATEGSAATKAGDSPAEAKAARLAKVEFKGEPAQSLAKIQGHSALLAGPETTVRQAAASTKALVPMPLSTQGNEEAVQASKPNEAGRAKAKKQLSDTEGRDVPETGATEAVLRVTKKGRSSRSDEPPEGLPAGAQNGLVAQGPAAEGKSKRVGTKDEATEARPVDEPGAKAKNRDDTTLASRIQILDQRRAASKKDAAADEAKGVESASEKGHSSSRSEEQSRKGEILIDASNREPKRSEGAQTAGPEAARGDFASLLADRLRDTGNTEIVQSARIVLRDGDSGTIRMRLNPPELGNVKIELNLADNNIIGRIIVESDEAKSAFEKGLSSLQDAFRSGGFESAKLNVEVGSGNGGQAAWNGSGQEGKPDTGPFWSNRSRDNAFGTATQAAIRQGSWSDKAVDIVV